MFGRAVESGWVYTMDYYPTVEMARRDMAVKKELHWMSDHGVDPEFYDEYFKWTLVQARGK
jgi:hypothetical protein